MILNSFFFITYINGSFYVIFIYYYSYDNIYNSYSSSTFIFFLFNNKLPQTLIIPAKNPAYLIAVPVCYATSSEK